MYWSTWFSLLSEVFHFHHQVANHKTSVTHDIFYLNSRPIYFLQDFKFSQQCWWRLNSSGMSCCVTQWKVPENSKKGSASQTLETIQPSTQDHIPEEMDLHLHLVLRFWEYSNFFGVNVIVAAVVVLVLVVVAVTAAAVVVVVVVVVNS
jgi:hypothetical protein